MVVVVVVVGLLVGYNNKKQKMTTKDKWTAEDLSVLGYQLSSGREDSACIIQTTFLFLRNGT